MRSISLIFVLFMSICLNAQNTNNCLDFDGENDFLELENAIIPVGQFQEWTVEFWLKTESTEHDVIFAQYYQYNDYRCQFSINANTPNKFFYWKPSSGGLIVTSSTEINDGRWYHIAVSRRFDGQVILYVNGEQEDTGTDFSGMPDASSLIGRVYNTDEDYKFFDGRLDAFRIWNTARTQEEINEFMNVEFESTNDDLITNINFNQGIASGNNPTEGIALDASVNGNDAILYGFNLYGDFSNYVLRDLANSSIDLASTVKTEVFPNPNAGIFTIRAENESIQKIELLDLNMRRLVKQSNISQTDTLINIDAPYSGVYFLHIEFEDGSAQIRKILIHSAN